MSEPTLRCPGCGAPAVADAAACAYCGSALATVTCPSCFAPMFAGSRFCAHCGAEAIREKIDDGAQLLCPRCREPLQSLRLGMTKVRECGACGGLWLDPDSLQRLADGREEHAAVVSALAARIPATSTVEDVVHYLPCPSCAKLMNRVNFAHVSGVVLDVCKTHGLWLDRGELQRVLQFIDAGGLSVARDHECARLADEQRRLTALMNAPGRTFDPDRPAYAPSHDGQHGDSTLLQRFLLDALGAVHG